MRQKGNGKTEGRPQNTSNPRVCRSASSVIVLGGNFDVQDTVERVRNIVESIEIYSLSFPTGGHAAEGNALQ
jgi:hypothetical protein